MSVRVVARIRPLLEKELDKDTIIRPATSDDGKTNIVKIPNPRNLSEEFSFTFNNVYDQSTTQEQLFTAEIQPYLKSLFQGLDVTIFAYGVTGTGKTHTMRGGMKLAERGVIPRLLSGVFRRAKKVEDESEGETTVEVALSYYEIYNDKVFDLLEPVEKRTPSGLPLRAEANGKTVVAGLSERPCQELQDFEDLYIEANNNRVTAATKLNAHSSRSHAILRVKVTQTTGNMVRESTASAIDLAGSEDNRRTDNGKERLVESAAINKSLFVLSQCIDAIGRGEKRIPFRESKMTRILSLGQNNGITIMILNLSPLRSYHLDTLSSLNVSSRAKRIEVREVQNEVIIKAPLPRPVANVGGLTGPRQPLRPLKDGNNTSGGLTGLKPTERPVKTFTVYSDKGKPPPVSRPANTAVKRAPQPAYLKRYSDQENILVKPSKITKPELARPTPVGRQLKPPQPTQFSQLPQPSQPTQLPKLSQLTPPSQLTQPTQRPQSPRSPQTPQSTKSHRVTMSADEIEAMVEKKVSEILAARTQSAAAQPELNDEVKRRLEALERRIEDGRQDEARTEGLRFLLMARQHKERKEYTSAMKMYEMALEYFPGQAKILGKMEKLKALIAAQRASWAEQPMSKKSLLFAEMDDDAYISSDDDDNDENDTYVTKLKPCKALPKPKAFKMEEPVIDQEAVSQTLLDIVNSRDISMIMELQGLGPKKARDLVQFLDEQLEEEGSRVESITELRTIPGMGGRAVERAMEGLVAAGVC